MGTKINVANEATKWGEATNCELDSRWMRGPAFLYEDEKDWPKDKFKVIVKHTEQELRSAVVCSHFLSSPIIDMSRFSKYERLLRSVAHAYRFGERLLLLQKNMETEDVSSVELRNAERVI